VPGEFLLLVSTTAGVAVAHTVLGPDHYLPFIAMHRARLWSRAKTLRVTLLCGLGHVGVSLLLGAVGVALGLSLDQLGVVDTVRGSVAAWILICFGLVYAAWGLRRALRKEPHSHWHAHADGVVHDHDHRHEGAHVHVHDPKPVRSATAWTLFTVFALGPCEPLVPLLLVPAATGTPLRIAAVAGVFVVVTLASMLAIVAAATLRGTARRALPAWRFGPAVAGGLVCACGVGMEFFGL